VVHGGRIDLINAHDPTSLPLIGPEQADALDVIQVQNGRSFSGDSQQLTSYLAKDGHRVQRNDHAESEEIAGSVGAKCGGG
jgi:hypothetical protein